jgi:hypothetical protein
VPRLDLQQVIVHAGRILRRHAGALLNWQPMVQYALTLDAAGRRTEVEYLPHASFVLTRGTIAVLGYRFGRERYREQDYDQARAELKLSTTPKPWLSIFAKGMHGRRVRYDLDLTTPDLTFVASFDELNGSVELRLGKHAALSGTGTLRHLGGGGSVLPATVRMGRLAMLYHLSAITYVRAIAQYDPAEHTRDFSALAAIELNYGTQLDLGADYNASDALSGARITRHSVFARVSYLLRR